MLEAAPTRRSRSRQGPDARPAYRDMTFEARAGEVLGIYGFMGCGQLELARTLFGKLRADSGALEIDGKAEGAANTTAAKTAGVAYVAESRRAMLFGEEPVFKNISIAILERLSRWLLKPDREREIAAEQVKSLDIRPPRIEARLGALSGGNQQKVALAKWLTHPPAHPAARRADARHGRRRQGGRRQNRARACAIKASRSSSSRPSPRPFFRSPIAFW